MRFFSRGKKAAEINAPSDGYEEQRKCGRLKRFVAALASRRAGVRLRSWLDKCAASTPPYRLSGTDKLTGILLFAFYLSLYLYTCSHHPNPAGDSPELIGASYSLGVVHPPGYPLYTMLGYLFTRLPIGSIAFRVNMSSAFYHSLALLLFFLCCMKMTRSRPASAIAAVVLGFAPLFWFYSLMAEVFPLNDLLVMLIVFVAIRARERYLEGNRDGSLRLTVLAAFLCGLSLCNHHIVILVFPMVLLFLLQPLIEVLKRPRYVLYCIIAFAAGLLPYVYLPLSASRGPYINFGDPSSLRNFFDVITRRHYGTTSLWHGPEAGHRLDLVFDFLRTLSNQVRVGGFLLALVGIVHMAKKRIGDFLPLAAGFFATAVLFLFLANVKLTLVFHFSTIERFYILPTIIFSFFIASGAAAVLAWVGKALKKAAIRLDLKKALLWMLILLLSLPFLLPAHTVVTQVSLKYDALGETYIENLLASVDDGSLVFLQGDVPIQLLEYYDTCVKGSKKVIILTQPFLLIPWYAETVHKWWPDLKFITTAEMPYRKGMRSEEMFFLSMDYIMNNNPQISSFHVISKLPYLEEKYDLIPWGITFKVVPKGTTLDFQDYWQRQLAIWRNFKSLGLSPNFYPFNRREFDLLPHISQYPYELGKYLSAAGYKQEALPFMLLSISFFPNQTYVQDIAETYRETGNLAQCYNYYRLVSAMLTAGAEGYDKAAFGSNLRLLEDILEELHGETENH